jgi:hypothetical protein
VTDRGDKVPHVLLVDPANGSEPEAVGPAQLAGIDDEAARPQMLIEVFKLEVRLIRITCSLDALTANNQPDGGPMAAPSPD